MRPASVAYDAGGDLFIADTARNQVFEISVGGTVTVVAGLHVDGATDADVHILVENCDRVIEQLIGGPLAAAFVPGAHQHGEAELAEGPSNS